MMEKIAIPFLMSMLLGRSIDLRTYFIGGDVYDSTNYDETRLNRLNATYTVLLDNVFPYASIGLPIDLVLRIKSSSLSSSSGALGLDGFLRESAWKSDSVVVAFTSMVQTVSRALKSDSQPVSGWLDHVDNSQTHYARSELYGGWSAVLYRFKCEVSQDINVVRRIVTSHFGVNGVTNERIIDQWKRVYEEIQSSNEIIGRVDTIISSYSSESNFGDVSTPGNLLEAIRKFPDDVGQLGKPLFVELMPLHALDSRFAVVTKNLEAEAELTDTDAIFDDLRSTKAAMRKWMTDSLEDYTEEEDQRITTFYENLSGLFSLYLKVANEASLFATFTLKDKDHLKLSRDLYKNGLTENVKSYGQAFRNLREDLERDCGDAFLDRSKGLLRVEDGEEVGLGEVGEGLAKCKALCLEDGRCRAISFAESVPVVSDARKTAEGAMPGIKITRKLNQCKIYYRSTSTAFGISSKGVGSARIYDRKCN